MEFKLDYPFKPFTVTQLWGEPNSAYAQFGFTRHNGVDCKPRSLDTVWPIYMPAAGFKAQVVRYNEKGGGHEIWFLSKEKYQIGDKFCYAYMAFAHGEKILIPVGYEPAHGELFMIGDHTGFSTGPHTHWSLYRVDYDGARFTFLDDNGANGTYDQSAFYTQEYAVDNASVPTLIRSNLRYYQYVASTPSYLQKLLSQARR